ncbi:MAG: lipopolysaccharide kinase InaA family protein [Gammaproteobacteria bacterium]|nr:lipopolysaccharide kinase InaA family protein [Gammaproteobacteria bacterium]
MHGEPETIRRKNFTRVVVYDVRDSSDQLKELLDDPDRYLLDRGGSILKTDRASTVGLAEIDSRTLVIKRYNTRGIGHAIRRSLRRSRASICWRNAHDLLNIGVETPRPVGFIEQRFGPVRRRSYLITEYVQGEVCLSFFQSNKNDELLSKVTTGLVTVFQTLAKCRMSHGDLKATNIIIQEGCPILIDLDGMHSHRSTFAFQRAFERDKERFLRNWSEMPAIEELFRARLTGP